MQRESLITSCKQTDYQFPSNGYLLQNHLPSVCIAEHAHQGGRVGKRESFVAVKVLLSNNQNTDISLTLF